VQVARGKASSPDKDFPPLSPLPKRDNRREKGIRRGTLRPQRLYEHLLLVLRFVILDSMLIFSCVVLAIPLIVAASGGVSRPVLGVFEGLVSRFGPRVSRLHSRQNFYVPPECEAVCDTFQNTVAVGTFTFTTSSPAEPS
jgi:hypothetical protein